MRSSLFKMAEISQVWSHLLQSYQTWHIVLPQTNLMFCLHLIILDLNGSSKILWRRLCFYSLLLAVPLHVWMKSLTFFYTYVYCAFKHRGLLCKWPNPVTPSLAPLTSFRGQRKAQENLKKYFLSPHLQLEEKETSAEIPFSGLSPLLWVKLLTYKDENTYSTYIHYMDAVAAPGLS